MPVKIKTVSYRHPICFSKCPKQLDPLMHKFWYTRNLSYIEADGAVIATDGDKIVGFFRYMVGKYKWYDSIGGLGTYIMPEYRNIKLASKMWAAALKKIKPAFVIITMTSRKMNLLVKSLERKFPSIQFYTKKDFK